MSKGKSSRSKEDMGDKTFLLSVEELINVAFGSSSGNRVDLKTIQTVLHILARQMRMLEQLVEIRLDDLAELEKQVLMPSSGSMKATDASRSKTGTSKGKVKGAKKGAPGKADKAKAKSPRDISQGGTSKGRVSYSDFNEKMQGTYTTPDTDMDRSDDPDALMGESERESFDEGHRKYSLRDPRGKSSAAEITPYESIPKRTSKLRISVSERRQGDDKVLVVDRQLGAAPGYSTQPRSSKPGIEVISRSQFRMLESAVKQLQELVIVPEKPTLPTNDKLVDELLKGTASLTNTMATMQVNARIEAAEQATTRMACILTKLAAMGTLPPELAKHLPDEQAITFLGGELSSFEPPGTAHSTRVPSAVTHVPMGAEATITHEEMEVSFLGAREDIMKRLTHTIAKAIQNADNAVYIARSASDKVEVAMNLNKRISALYSMVADYSDQLSGFDAGINTQMQGFQEQIGNMRADLKVGLEQLEAINTNAESAALLELTERYEGLLADLETGMNGHQLLLNAQDRLGEELKNLIVCLEILRDQKADRDEVWDGLKDKADITRLSGLLPQAIFNRTRHELEEKINQCHTKFQKQDQTWTHALTEVGNEVELKADLVVLLAEREHMQRELQKLLEKTQKLEERLGEPMAAILTREINRGARCAGCMAPVLMAPNEPTSNVPMKLPAFKTEKLDEVCLTTVLPPEKHACNRWVGGSHTLLTDTVTRGRPAQDVAALAPPQKRYLDYGNDGRLYKMAEDCLPCVECNLPAEIVLPPEPVQPTPPPKVKPWKRLPGYTTSAKPGKEDAQYELAQKSDDAQDKKSKESQKTEDLPQEVGAGDNVAESPRQETIPQDDKTKQQTLEPEQTSLETDQQVAVTQLVSPQENQRTMEKELQPIEEETQDQIVPTEGQPAGENIADLEVADAERV